MSVRVPLPEELMVPTVVALRGLGGSGRVTEINEEVIEAEGFSEEQLSFSMKTGTSKIEYRLAWARTYLKNIGAVTNSSRAVWSLTKKGLTIGDEQIQSEWSSWRTASREPKGDSQREQAEDSNEPDSDSELDSEWQERLITRLQEMAPSSFERLTQRLLREAGFRDVKVLGRSGDEGLDGVGVHMVSLMSFRVYFQCKRWRKPVAARDVRDFRGAMSGRGEQGILISTASFTQGARKEATRDNAPLVDLVSGTDLCELLKRYGLGVNVEKVEVEDVSVDAAFFDQF